MRLAFICCLGLALSACGGLTRGTRTPAAPAGDPTPLAKCRIAANASNPLVTEWPASEKAHLQSLITDRAVAVTYSGCDLRIIDGCRLPGHYEWRRTTLATDTVEIANADELFAKLPIGAFGLEGELERSGRLAVQTTVAGQMKAEGVPERLEPGTACAKATHYIAAISVGAFRLLSGNRESGGGEVRVVGIGAGARRSSREVVLREAGLRDACSEATDESPDTQCASPIQLFLAPLAGAGTEPPSGPRPGREEAGAIQVQLPVEDDERWTLRNHRAEIVCALPCETWVPPVSGYYLQREEDKARLPLPESFPHRPGTRVEAAFQIGRGNPTLSKLTFYGAGIPTAALGVGMIAWGIATSASNCGESKDPTDDCFPPPGFLYGSGLMFLGFAGASTWWFLWSREERFETSESVPAAAGGPRTGTGVVLGPGFVTGTF